MIVSSHQQYSRAVMEVQEWLDATHNTVQLWGDTDLERVSLHTNLERLKVYLTFLKKTGILRELDTQRYWKVTLLSVSKQKIKCALCPVYIFRLSFEVAKTI